MIGFLLSRVKKYFSSIKWRKINSHNFTEQKNSFPIELVKVGSYSYGFIDVVNFNPANTRLQIQIGNFVTIAPEVKFLINENHQTKSFTSYPIKSKLFNLQNDEDAFSKGPIIIEDEVWIGYGVIILSGVKIGKGAIVAAGSIVSNNIEPYSIYGGIPAKKIKNRFSDDVINKLINVDLAKISINDIGSNLELFYSDISDPSVLNKLLTLEKKSS
jgi:virginiamycin A acetyltransferase